MRSKSGNPGCAGRRNSNANGDRTLASTCFKGPISMGHLPHGLLVTRQRMRAALEFLVGRGILLSLPGRATVWSEQSTATRGAAFGVRHRAPRITTRAVFCASALLSDPKALRIYTNHVMLCLSICHGTQSGQYAVE